MYPLEGAMFIGEYRHTADAKGRVSVPAKFREELGGTFFISKGLDQTLTIYPPKEWERFQEKLLTASVMNAQARAFNRMFFSGAAEVELDKQGRILIPPQLRDYAKIDKDLIIIGNGPRVEIWSQEVWDAYISRDGMSLNSLAEHMETMGI